MGRLASVPPPGTEFNPLGDPRTPTLEQGYQAWQAFLDMLLADWHNAVATDVTIATGKAALGDTAAARLLPETGSSDDLLQLDLDTVPEGRLVFLSCGVGADPITVKHLASGITDDGEIELADSADYVLGNPHDFLLLRRVGSKFVQHRVLGTAAAATRVGPLGADVDMGGYAAFNGRYFVDEHASSTRTIGVGDRGKLLVNTASCTYTLPMAQPVSGPQWQVGDVVWFRQEAGSCIFVRAGGGVPRNLDGHDRGRGIGARMELELVQVTPSFVWSLVGMTTAPGGGGSPTVRTYVKASSPNTINTDPASTAWKDVLTINHTPGSSESWLYLGHMGFRCGANAFTIQGLARIQAGGAGPQFGGPRYATGQEAPLLMTGKAYGSSPGAQAIALGIKSGNAAYAASAVGPALVGIRLESGEYLSLAAGSAGNLSSTSYQDMVTLTQTLAADDYYAFAWCQWESDQQAGVTLALDVDGTLKHEKAMAWHTQQAGYFGVIYPFTGTAASHTLKLRAKCNGSFNASITQMGICLLRKANFQDVASANDGSSTTISSPTFGDKASLSHGLLEAWDYLALGDIDLQFDTDASAAGAQAQLARNGSRIGQFARSLPRVEATWCPVSAGALQVVQAQMTTDSFAEQYASVRAGDVTTGKEATVLLLSLAPI